MSDYHPDVRLDHGSTEVWLNYDGSLSLSDNAAVLSRDGVALGHRHGHVYVLCADDPDYAAFVRVLARTHSDHYAALDLRPPTPADLPLHFLETP